jgi:hypothetical protein
MSAAKIAVVASCVYFFGFGAAYLFRPQLADQLGLEWLNPAGRTEIRCSYGALSWALAAFFGYLVSEHHSVLALTGVLFLAGAVLATRLVGTTVDRAWGERYTKMAVPIETAFVLALGAVRLFG